jgi:hypothetical protein
MLVLNEDHIKEFLPVNVTIDFDVYKPYCFDAEIGYIQKILGLDQYAALEAYAEDESNAFFDHALKLSRKAIIHMAFYLGFDILNVSIEDSGFHRLESEQSKSLFNYQERNIKAYFVNQGFEALEALMAYLEKNEAEFTDWAADPEAYSIVNESFINTAVEFTRHYSALKNSRLVFLKWKSAMQYAEERNLRVILGDDLFDKLKELIKDGDIKEVANIDYKNTLPYIRRALAFWTVYHGIKELGLNFSDRGAFFQSTFAAGSNMISEKDLSESDVEYQKEIVLERAVFYNKELTRYLTSKIENLPEYSDFINSKVYESQSLIDNVDKKTYRAF